MKIKLHYLGIKAAIEGNSYGGMLDLWLSHVKNVYEKYQEELDDIEDENAKCARLCELNVVEQVMNVWKNPYVQKSWKKGHPVWVHGWIFRVETGYLDELIVESAMPSFLSVFQFKFEDQTPHHARQSGHQKSVYRKSIIEPSFYSNDRSHNSNSPVHSQKSSMVDRKKTNIWVFDDFLSAQNELMMKNDQIEEPPMSHSEEL